MIREKQTTSGKLFEVDFYPVWNDGRRIPSRAPKSKHSTAEQEKYNQMQAVKRFVRTINGNYDDSDNIMTVTYEPAKAPLDEEQARRDVRNYFRRIKRRRLSELKQAEKALKAMPNIEELAVQRKALKEKIKKLKAPLKWSYGMHCTTYKSGRYAGRKNYHFHIFITGGLDRDTMEKMWNDGMRTNCDRFQPEKFGPETMARYIASSAEGTKRFVCSRTVEKPKEPKIKDGRITARGVEQIAKFRSDDKEYWEKRYKGYRFIRCYPRYNEYNGNWYVSVIMYKTDNGPLPQWQIENWVDM